MRKRKNSFPSNPRQKGAFSVKKFLKVVLPIFILIVLVSCQEKKPYVGTWDDGNMTIILKADNTFEIKDEEGALRGTYEVTDGVLKLSVDDVEEDNPVNKHIKSGDVIEVDIKVENGVLSVTYDAKVYDFPKK